MKLRPPFNDLIFTSTNVKTKIIDVDSRGQCIFDSLLVYYVSDKEFQRLRRVNSSIELSICQQNTTDKVVLHMSDIKNVLHNRSNNHIYQFASNEGHSRDVIGRKKELIIDFDFREMPHKANDKPKPVIKKIPLTKPKSSLVDINIGKFNAAMKRLEPSLTSAPAPNQKRRKVESPRASTLNKQKVNHPASNHRPTDVESPRVSALNQQKVNYPSSNHRRTDIESLRVPALNQQKVNDPAPNHRRTNIESPQVSAIHLQKVNQHALNQRPTSIESPRIAAIHQQKVDHKCIKCRAITAGYRVCNACVYEVFASPETTKPKRKHAAESSSSNIGNLHTINRYFRAARDNPLQQKRYKTFTERMGIPPSIPVS